MVTLMHYTNYDVTLLNLNSDFGGKRMSPTYQTDLSLKTVTIIFLFLCVMWLMGAIFQNLSSSVTMKMGSRSPKSNGVKVTKI